MESFECDVVIVGAGLSGLSAAYYLSQKDKSLRIIVLEAKDRIGGRTLTKQLMAADGTRDFWDLGGEWIGRPQPHMHYLLKKFQVNTFQPVSPTCGGRQMSCVNQFSWQVYFDLQQFKWKLRRLQKKVESVDQDGLKQLLNLDEIILETFIEDNMWTADAKAVVGAACHCMFGISTAEMTVSFFLSNVEAAGGLDILIKPEEVRGGEFRVKGGVQQLANHLVNKIGKQHVFLSQPVVQIVQSIEGARVTTLNGMHILSQRVIMAVPPHHSATVEYVPALPSAKLELLKKIPLAFLIKFSITYESAFWKKGKNSQRRGFQAVLTDVHMGPIGLVYDATSGRGNPALSGFLSHADKIDPDPKKRQILILQLIEQLLGPQCRQHLEFVQMDWSQEPYNGGCFLKNFNPEIFKWSSSEIRKPEDRIHFAGTESATVWCGFLNGAVQAGFRAASEVLHHLRPLLTASQYPEKETKDKPELQEPSKSSSWLSWLGIGAGVTALIYFMIKTNRTSKTSDVFVRNIRLIFDP